jgi:predicted ATP-dependent serine protease
MQGKKNKTQFECQNCGYASPRWLGKCPECGSWNSFVEEKVLIKGAEASVKISSNTAGFC